MTSQLTSHLPPVQVGTFEGPLDLLLHLVRAGRMDIFDLPIAVLCDHYMAYLNAMEEMDLAIAGEFLVMAATLLEIKSRLLLPPPPKPETDNDDEMPEEDPRAELVRRLLEYGKFQGIADRLRDCEGERRQLFFRPRADLSPEYRLPPRFGELSAEQLLRTLERLLVSVGAGERQITSVRRQKITLRMKMREVLVATEHAMPEGLVLDALLPEAPFALIEVVLLFLALLELLKAGTIRVFQEEFCGEIRVFSIPEGEREAPDVESETIAEESEDGR